MLLKANKGTIIFLKLNGNKDIVQTKRWGFKPPSSSLLGNYKI